MRMKNANAITYDYMKKWVNALDLQSLGNMVDLIGIEDNDLSVYTEEELLKIKEKLATYLYTGIKTHKILL